MSISGQVFAQTGILRGRVSDTEGGPLAEVAVSLATKSGSRSLSLMSDQDGYFHSTGLRIGNYKLSFEKTGFKVHSLPDIHVEPSHCLTIEVTLAEAGTALSSRSLVIKIDPTSNLQQSVMYDTQIYGMPIAHNVWSLIENQDLSATTNRIDVGGLWSGIPALFSSRGGISWTQSRYAINGMDVTDPFRPGRPLIYPDFYGLALTQHINSGHPAALSTPGGYFNLITKRGTDRFQGAVSTFYISHALQANNITPELESEGLYESNKFNYMLDGNIQVSGPIIPEKLTFFASVSAFDLSRDIAEYQQEDPTSLLSGQVELDYQLASGLLRFFWTGQRLDHSSWGADRHVPLSSTIQRKEHYDLFQATWDTQLSPGHSLRAGLSYVHGQTQSDFQDEIPGPYGIDIFQRLPQGAAPWAALEKRSSLTLQLQGESLFSGLLNARHRFNYGVQVQNSTSESQTEIWENIHLHFYKDKGLEVVRFSAPFEHQEKSWNISFHVQDALTFGNFLTLYAGLNLTASKASALGNENTISWFNLAPRLGIILPLSSSRSSALKMSFARYYYALPLDFMTYGSSDAWGGLVHAWNDVNQDLQFQENELGNLLRREGPLYSGLDPQVKRPATDEVSISYNLVFGSDWYFYLGGFYRRTHDLIRTLNTGVPFGAYDPEHYLDWGDDGILYTHDDQIFTVFNQKPDSFGQDYFLLTNLNPDERSSLYFGLDLNLIKKFGDKFTFLLSLTATQADGDTNPGSTELENDDGVLGALLDNPNTLINSRGRMRFDRAYTGRIGIDYLAPWDIRLGCVVKYYDGQPFSRQIIIEGMNQGPYYIQAHPRGRMRYEYNRTLDIRIEKMVPLKSTRLRIILDAFNLLNRSLATEETPWSGPKFQGRYALEIQSPRVFRLGLVFDF